MAPMPQFPQPKPNRLKGYDYTDSGVYFVTICTHQKECLFATVKAGVVHLNPLGIIVQEEWYRSETLRQGLRLDSFIVMPNHFHALLLLTKTAHQPAKPVFSPSRGLELIRSPDSLGSIIAGFKAVTTKRIRQFLKNPGKKVWQRGYFDRVIRNEQEWGDTQDYIRANPARWGSEFH